MRVVQHGTAKAAWGITRGGDLVAKKAEIRLALRGQALFSATFCALKEWPEKAIFKRKIFVGRVVGLGIKPALTY